MRSKLAALGGATLLLIAVPGCSFAVGAGTAAVLVGAGVLASSCYDHVDVGVRDARGVPLCDAEVIAIRGDDEVDLVPCFSAALTAGTWRIEARHGRQVAQSTLTIPEDRECGRVVHRIELTVAAQTPTSSLTAKPIRSSGTTSSTTPISTAALGMP